MLKCVYEASDALTAISNRPGRKDESHSEFSSMFFLGLEEDAEDFKKRKISCKDIAFTLDEALTYLESTGQEDLPNPEVFGIGQRLLRSLIPLRGRIGNRREKPPALTEEQRLQQIALLQDALRQIKKLKS